MIKDTTISGYYTTTQAASILCISSHEAARLARDGRIKAIKAVGDALLLDAIDVQQYKNLHQGKGRPLSPDIAWAALLILSGFDVEWLSYPQLRRLKLKLKTTSALDLLWQARNRLQTKRYRASESFFKELRNELILTGSSSSLFEFSLVEQKHVLEGYTTVNFEILEKKYHLVEDTNGNAIIHSAHGHVWFFNKTETIPIAVAAADLAVSLDTREKQAGLAALERLLDEYRKNQS